MDRSVERPTAVPEAVVVSAVVVVEAVEADLVVVVRRSPWVRRRIQEVSTTLSVVVMVETASEESRARRPSARCWRCPINLVERPEPKLLRTALRHK